MDLTIPVVRISEVRQYTERTKVFVQVPTVPHGRNTHATYVISTENNFKRLNISNHRLNLK